jgi:hypothetical protein
LYEDENSISDYSCTEDLDGLGKTYTKYPVNMNSRISELAQKVGPEIEPQKCESNSNRKSKKLLVNIDGAYVFNSGKISVVEWKASKSPINPNENPIMASEFIYRETSREKKKIFVQKKPDISGLKNAKANL